MSTQPVRIIAAVLALCAAMFAQEQKPGQKSEAAAPSVTEISADLGPCSAEFKVTDLQGKPLYNAKISTQVRYGFMGVKKLDLEIGTDSNGRARFVKLPAQIKKGPMTFKVTHGDETADLSYDPATNCNANYSVPLGKPVAEKQEKK